MPILRPRRRASASSPRPDISTPSMVISPVVGASSPAMRPSKVDFPLPDGPTIETYCPEPTVRSSGCTMVSGALPLTTVLETLRSSIMRSLVDRRRVGGRCQRGERRGPPTAAPPGA